MHFPPVCPEVPVSTLAALEYYRDKLGFTVDWSDEQLGLAGLSRGDTRIFMSAAEYRTAIGNRPPIVLWLNLASRAEVDALYEQWTVAGATIAAPPQAKSYKLYEFLAPDPDGNVFRVFYDFGWEER